MTRSYLPAADRGFVGGARRLTPVKKIRRQSAVSK